MKTLSSMQSKERGSCKKRANPEGDCILEKENKSMRKAGHQYGHKEKTLSSTGKEGEPW